MKVNTVIIDRVLQNRIITHILFWIFLLGSSTFLTSLNYGSFKNHFINNLVLLPTQLISAYLLSYYQIPKLLFKNKYLQFLISCIICVAVFPVIARLSIIYIAEPLIRSDFQPETLSEVLADPRYLFTVYLPAVYIFPLILLTVKIIKEHFLQKRQLENLQKEKVTAELNFLKAQIHPHFLFNTLNNLYVLTLDKSDIAPKIVIKLSKILDYILYECSDSKVPISKEKELLQHYVDLEALRYGDKLDLKIDCQIDSSETEIAPLILLSLVENAFKHGASGNLINPLIHIQLILENQHLNFKIFNTKPVLEQAQNSNLKKGLGSSNIKRQLDLIYPDRYNLKIDEKLDSYLVNLYIEL